MKLEFKLVPKNTEINKKGWICDEFPRYRASAAVVVAVVVDGLQPAAGVHPLLASRWVGHPATLCLSGSLVLRDPVKDQTSARIDCPMMARQTDNSNMS